MRVIVKFKTPMTKNGRRFEVGDELEMDATAALNLHEKGSVEIPGYKVVEVEKVVVGKTLVEVDE
jgi:hypothetical protein